jgi:hypothetical protein
MGCSKCKEKKIIAKEGKKEFNSIDKVMTWVIGSWFLLGVYGLYSLICNIIKLL